MSLTYTYSLSTDFTTSHAITLLIFIQDIKNSSISSILRDIEINGDSVIIGFLSSLSIPDKTTLDLVVQDHVAGTIPFPPLGPTGPTGSTGIDEHVALGLNTGITFTAGTTLIFDTTISQSGSVTWDSGTGLVTVANTGTYMITANAENSVFAIRVSTVTPDFYVNARCGIMTVQLSAGTTIGLVSASTTTVAGSISISGKLAYNSYMSVVRIV